MIESAPPLTTRQLEALATLAKHLGPGLATTLHELQSPAPSTFSPATFGERSFYLPETGQPIQLLPHQRLILALMFDTRYAPQLMGDPQALSFQTLVYSTVKKSGKTTIAALCARYVCENWGKFNEVYSIANDKEQSRGRVYAKALQSIQLDPRWSITDKSIPNYWRIIEREATHLPSGSYLRAVSNDYRGEAGSNPTATFWSELWGYTLEASRRLWDEMTPVPTRPRSIRFVETYAGFEGESTLLIDLYNKTTSPDRGAYQLTTQTLQSLDPPLEWPFPTPRPNESPDDNDHSEPVPLPLYVNPSLRSMTYWDSGPEARRMPWQTPEYYAAQATEMRPEVFDRLHNNYWVSPISGFIPAQWWESCHASQADAIPPLTLNEPIVVAADASVSGDCTSLVAVSRNPNSHLRTAKHTVARLCATFTPPKAKDGRLDYNAPGGFKDTIRDWSQRYRIVELAYDPYQLHDPMILLREELQLWTRPFSQGDERMVADFGLYTDIRDRKILDDTQSTQLADHLNNAAARIPKDSNTKLRIVKRAADRHIDNVVALSMANYECKRLLLD